jgi:lipoate-protein ligase A
MALDHALLDRAERTGATCLRLYRWTPSCLSFGRNEPALRRYDREAIERRELAVVRRPSGGRAVWHLDELTYAVAGPIATFGSLAAAYRAIHGLLARALRTLGVATEFAPHNPAYALERGACFSSSAGGEVLAGGRKLTGSAQRQQGTAFLQHGSLLLAGDQSLLNTVTRGSAPPDGSASLASTLGRSVSFQELAAAIAAEFPVRGAPPGLPDEVRTAAGARMGTYRSPEWTWRR